MFLPSCPRPVKAALLLVLILTFISTASSNLKPVTLTGVSGKKVTWLHREPVGYGQRLKTFFWDRVVNILITDNEAKYGCRPIATGVILDRNRVLTSYNPFIELSKDTSPIKDMYIYVNIGRIVHANDPVGGLVYFHLHEMWSGRRVTFSPEESTSSKSWHGRGADKRSPLHDLMVLRVKPDFDSKFQFTHMAEKDIAVGKVNIVFTMDIARPNERLEYPLRYCQLNIDGEREHQHFDFVTEDNVIVDCDLYIPKHWGLFICVKNNHDLKGLSSSAILVSNQTVFGIGSFAHKRDGQQAILVFTDVRPYYDLIMNAMTDDDTKL
ncbi:uncharacterized protein LOC113506833 [Trichoplusia ni]|uniref:Uncharacterized protein LOC113506833 n=1 Tax=Trichoplusia ni TaxID=7111 RepID=A0A7E5WZ70_TRINI|nr:uncharacterized protein LOC113506833 [Trichoplusia ni]